MFKITKKYMWLYIMGLHETLKHYDPIVLESIDFNYIHHKKDLHKWYHRIREL